VSTIPCPSLPGVFFPVDSEFVTNPDAKPDFFSNPPTRNPFQHDHSFRFGVGFGLEVLGITVKLRLMNVKLINLFYNCGPWKIRPLKLIEFIELTS